MQKYLTEARLLAKMEKQRVIVNVRDYFEDNRTAYIVMEYIQGITFTELTRKSGGHISEDLLFPVVEPLFGALCSLHQYGLIHRDMCPDNLMLETRQGPIYQTAVRGVLQAAKNRIRPPYAGNKGIRKDNLIWAGRRDDTGKE